MPAAVISANTKKPIAVKSRLHTRSIAVSTVKAATNISTILYMPLPATFTMPI